MFKCIRKAFHCLVTVTYFYILFIFLFFNKLYIPHILVMLQFKGPTRSLFWFFVASSFLVSVCGSAADEFYVINGLIVDSTSDDSFLCLSFLLMKPNRKHITAINSQMLSAWTSQTRYKSSHLEVYAAWRCYEENLCVAISTLRLERHFIKPWRRLSEEGKDFCLFSYWLFWQQTASK